MTCPNRIRTLLSGSALLALTCSAFQLAAASPVMPGVVLRTLPNGLRLLVREQHSAPLVAVGAWIRAGSGREEPGESGAAHFLEHLLFKGTATRMPGEIDGAIEDLGATLSAFTARDAAHLATTVPAAHAQTAVEVIADALRNSALRPEEVERERSVILDELARGRNDVQKEVENLAFAHLEPGRPYANPILGTPASIRALSRDAITAFYRRWYAPSNTTVVIVGDIAVDRAEELVKAAFGSWSGPSYPAPAAGHAPEPSSQSAEKAPRLQAQVVSVGVPAGKQYAAAAFRVGSDRPALDAAAGMVIAALLGDPRSGRLAAAPERNEPKSPRSGGPGVAARDDVSGTYAPLPGSSMLVVGGFVRDQKAVELAKAVDQEIERLQREPPSADEVEIARRQVIGPYLYEIETYAGQASALGRYDVLGDYTAAQTLVDALSALKPADLTAFAQKWLTQANRADILLNPPARP